MEATPNGGGKYYDEVEVGGIKEAWERARAIPMIFSGGSVVFRGQADSSWELTTTIERACGPDCLSLMSDRERHVLEQFRRRAHHVFPSVPEDPLGSLALIQNYGGPTRLLDFTRSFYVAAFFAIEHGARSGAAVWMVDLGGLIARAKYLLGVTCAEESEAISQFSTIANQYLQGERMAGGMVPVEPRQMSRRMDVQQGISLMPLSLHSSFVENLRRNFIEENMGNHVLKIVLPQLCYERGMKDLWDMNISSASLFPGREGFARSLDHQVRWQEPGSEA